LTLLPLQDKQRMLQQMAAPDNLTPTPANGPFLLESSGLAREPDGEAVGGPMTAGQPYPNDANPELAVNRGQDKSPKSDHPPPNTEFVSRSALSGRWSGGAHGRTIIPTWLQCCDQDHFMPGVVELDFQY
jgi:hypothetical protein